MFSAITKENLHHAYLIEGDARGLLEPLLDHLSRELGIRKNGNPNIRVDIAEMLEIKVAREIRERARMTAFDDDWGVFVLGARTISTEAQNALLKTLEEPGERTILFLIVPSKEILLSTVRSRLLDLRTPVDATSHGDATAALAEQFLLGEMAERLRIVSRIYKEEDRDVAREKAKALVAALIARYGRSEDRQSRDLERLMMTHKWLYSRSPSLKILLEGLAVTLPAKVSARAKR